MGAILARIALTYLPKIFLDHITNTTKHMDSITFAMPTLATSAMSRSDQVCVTLNQAAAAIVCCYLEHCNAAINKGIPGATSAAGTGGGAFLSQSELVSLINDVQGALVTTVD
jgi:hypothetical protein